MHVLAIDVGYSSLGLVHAEVCEFAIATVHLAEKLDLRDIPCLQGCKLLHTSNVVDRVNHLVIYYKDLFERAETILIERQPVGGLLDVQSLLYDKFRSKTTLVSPNAMHKHFGLPRGEYDRRKEMTIEIATPYLSHLLSFNRLHRKHDVADAMCMILFVTRQQQQQHLLAQDEESRRARTTQNRQLNCFDKFKFVKRKSKS